MRIAEITKDDVNEVAGWYIIRNIVKGEDMSDELAEQLAADNCGEGINGRH
jgi:hypothetical protein